LPVIGSLGPQRVFDRLYLGSDRLTGGDSQRDLLDL
jgi:hypothetical protein